MPYVHQRDYAMGETNRKPSSSGIRMPARKTVAKGSKYGGEPPVMRHGKYEMTTGAQTNLKKF